MLSVAPFASAKNKINTANSLLGLQLPKDQIGSSGQLHYCGGPVISHVKVFVGIWNGRVNSVVKPQMYAADEKV